MRRMICAGLLAVTLTGCGLDYHDLPLPGSSVGGDTYQVTASFDEALNLARGAQVKLNGVSIGRVAEVTAEDFRAQVTMDIRESVEIPADSAARLRYDTPLGELFVQVAPGTARRHLGDNERFHENSTTTAPAVEDALASASLLINGGQLSGLQVIAEEANAAFGGREDEIRASLRRVTRFLRQANASTGDLDSALRALRDVARTLASRDDVVQRALRELGPAAEALGRDTDKVVALLVDAEQLARAAGRLADRADDPLLEVLRKLGPVADAVLSTRSQFRRGLDSLIAVAHQLELTVPGETLPLQGYIHVDDSLLNILGDLGLGLRGNGASPPLLPGLDLLGRTGSR